MWSPEQLQAIGTRGSNLLVAAAAGSGKTAVLVERIIRRITDENDPLDIDRVLVVTFTSAASAEMRTRIGAALANELRKNPRSRHLARQLALLNAAPISTLHAFCQSVVRQNFHLLDLDPKFRVAAETETELLAAEVVEELFEECYAAADPDFLALVDNYGSDHGDEALSGLVRSLYRFSRSNPWPALWLAGLPDRLCSPAAVTVDDTPWSGLLREQAGLKLSQARQGLTSLVKRFGAAAGLADYQEIIAADQMILDDLLAAAGESWSRLATAVAAADFPRLKPVKEADPDLKEALKKVRQQAKDAVKALRDDYFGRPAAELMADLRQVAPLVGSLATLTTTFGTEFARAKRAKGLVDFNDLEHFCLTILLADGATPADPTPSPVTLALREKFAEVLVDEYQDTNAVQEAIIRLVASPERPNLFLVGDVKQSIYRFRLAEPELFLAKYRRYPLVAGGRERRIDLVRNFRSRAGILRAINFIFRQLMAPAVAELGYGPAEQLYPGADYPAAAVKTLAGPVEVHLIERQDPEPGPAGTADADSDPAAAKAGDDGVGTGGDEPTEAELSGFELEARLIARRISALVAEQYHVYDKNLAAYRPLAPRDIVILLRAVRGKAEILLDGLRQAGIPAYAELATGYFQETEVQIMLSLLSIIDNPRQDIPLAGVLRSPLAGFSTEDLAAVRLLKTGTDLWEALLAAGAAATVRPELKAAAREFITRLANWRRLARRRGVPELIWHIYNETGYYDYVGGLPGGTLRQANLRALYDRARQYETTNFRGLFRFLRFIERLRDRGSDLSVARALGESEDVVRIMSIHKSKGLEFPVVILADLGKNFNLGDSKQLLLCHKKLGVGPYVSDPALRIRYPTLARQAIAYKLDQETKAEELRVLYVALTRAREKLILVGSATRLADKCAAWGQAADQPAAVLPAAVVAGARSYLDWLGLALVRHADGAALRRLAGDERLPAGAVDEGSAWNIELYSRAAAAGPSAAAAVDRPLLEMVREFKPVAAAPGEPWVGEVLSWQYPYAAAVDKPAKLSVSEIKRRADEMLADETAGQLFERPATADRPRFLQAAGQLTAAEKGTLVHTVLQQLDLAGELSPAGLAGQLQTMIDRELILPEQAAAVDVPAIAAFFSSALGNRLRTADKVWREVPFSLALPGERFYPDLPPGETVFVQGIIDCLFAKGADLTLIDYKTDRINGDIAPAREKYRPQLDIYAQAVATIFRRPVSEKYLYFFAAGEAVKL